MPCSDITDVLQLRIDHDNRIVKYWLRKRSCGGVSGERSLIFDRLSAYHIDDLATLSASDFLNDVPIVDEMHEYLVLKHFFAVQTGVRILIGKESGRPNDFCEVEAIEYHNGGIDLLAHLRIDAITDDIRACSRCANCGIQ